MQQQKKLLVVKMGDEWKEQVKESYTKWKYNDIHKEVKSYFNTIQTEPLGEPYKKDSSSLIANLSELKDNVTESKNEDKIIKKNDDNSIEFLGDNINVGDADEEEVDNYCKETVFGGFWKTITKLCNTVYLALKSIGDVLKKLIKKLVDFFATGMKKAVLAIGHVIAKIVSWAHPLPDYETHEETGVLFVQDLKFNNYGETVANVPRLTFFPKNVEEIKKVILYAKSQKRRIRCAGMKHSWSEVFSNTGEILVYLLPLEVTDTITFARVGLEGMEPAIQKWGSELNKIEVR